MNFPKIIDGSLSPCTWLRSIQCIGIWRVTVPLYNIYSRRNLSRILSTLLFLMFLTHPTSSSCDLLGTSSELALTIDHLLYVTVTSTVISNLFDYVSTSHRTLHNNMVCNIWNKCLKLVSTWGDVPANASKEIWLKTRHKSTLTWKWETGKIMGYINCRMNNYLLHFLHILLLTFLYKKFLQSYVIVRAE